MNDNLIEILIHIFDTHFKGGEIKPISMDSLMDELIDQGFERSDIHNALDWLKEIIALYQAEADHTNRDSSSFRVFAESELSALSPEVRGYILYLERAGILDAVTRERVINRLLATNEIRIEEDHVKLITLLVLDHEREQYPQALNSMQTLIEAQQNDRLH